MKKLVNKVNVTRYPWKTKTPWCVNIPATVAGRRRREFFATRLKAEKRRDEIGEKIYYQGVGFIRDGSMLTSDALDSYLIAKSEMGQRHRNTLNMHCSRMRKAWGRMPVSSISIRDIERFTSQSEWGARTRYNALQAVKAFLNWCERRKLVASNPAKVLSEETRCPVAGKEILTPAEMRLLLRLTRRDSRMRAFLVFGGFAGVRTAEMLRLTWEDLAHGEIHIKPGIQKPTRAAWFMERYITITPAFERHCPEKGVGRILGSAERIFWEAHSRLRDRMAAVSQRIRAPWADRWQKGWPSNCLRHSFASYHMTECQDAGKTAYQMGHTSPRILYQNYFRAVREASAKEWWAL